MKRPSITRALEKEFIKEQINQNPSEFKWLLRKYVDLNPHRILEINGDNNLYKIWSKFTNKEAIIYRLNTNSLVGRSITHSNKNIITINGKFNLETLRRIHLLTGSEKLDFLFINSDISFKDLEIFMGLVRTKGLIVISGIHKKLGLRTDLCHQIRSSKYQMEEYCNYINDTNTRGLGVITKDAQKH